MSDSKSTEAKLTYGYTIALISAAILSTTAIFIRYLTQTYHMPPLVLAFWRDVFVVFTLLLVLTGIQPRLLRVSRRHLVYLLAFGFVLAMFNGVWTLSVSLNGAAISTVLVYSSAGFTALLGWWLLKECLDWAKLLAVVICLAGCALVSEALEPGNWHANWLGILTGILSGLCYAAYSLMGRSASQRGLNPWTTLFYTFGFATIFLLIFNLLPEGILPGTATHLVDFLWLGNAVSGWVVLFLLAAGPTVAGYGLYNVSLSHLPSSVVNLIATSEPVFTVIVAYLLLGELMKGMQLAGGVMIISGVVLLRLNESWLMTTPNRIWSRRKGVPVRAKNW